MNQKTNEDKVGPTDAWLKTITDMPVTDTGKNGSPVIKSPYAVPEMPPEVKIGEILGSGTILKVLGEGGFARVYKIHDDKLDLDRAVKVLLPTGKKEVSDRFLTEARITARLDNPNIVKVFRVDEWHGCPFIEMEYIDGKSLETILQERGTFPVYAVCAAGIFIATALKYAHTLEFTLSDQHYKGVIHRDLKPANIMLHSDGRLKLMDFGIARPISTGLHTMGENIVGTLQYLSPEQLNHKGIDQRTDIYAVGAILYELLCGSKAFPDEGLTDLVNKKASGIYKSFGEFPVSIPKKLAEVVDKCLRVDKEERYSGADSLIVALTYVYAQVSCVEPEIALKNFMENPDYSPSVAKVVKRKTRIPKETSLKAHEFKMPELRLPRLPQFHFPKISLPKLSFPKLSLPKLPRLQFPTKLIANVYHIFTSGVKNIITALLRFLKLFWTVPKNIGISVINRFKQVPWPVYKIGAAVITGIILVVAGLLIARYQFTGKPVVFSKQVTTDTVVTSEIPLKIISDSTNIVKTPGVLCPAVDTIWKSETLIVRWEHVEKADSLLVHIASSEAFADTIYIQAVSADTFGTITEIEPGKYFCRIGISVGDGTHTWSTSRFFTFSPNYRTPHLIAPAQGDTCKDREVTFRWRKVSKAKGYYINVAVDTDFTQLVFNDTNVCRDTFMNIIFYDSSHVTYFWHVRTKSDSTWSSTRFFTVMDKKNYHIEVSKALRKGKLSSAENALRKIDPADPYKDTLIIRLAEEYLKAKNFERAQLVLSEVVLKDMMVEYLRGQILINEGKYSEALSILDAAIGLKSLFATRVDSINLYYIRAVAAQRVYETKKNPQKGSRAYYAWESVIRIEPDTSHAYNKEARTKMNQLYHDDKVFGAESDTLKKKPVVTDSLKEPPGKVKKKGLLIRLKSL